MRHALSHTRIIACTRAHTNTHAGFFSLSLSPPLSRISMGSMGSTGVFLTHSHTKTHLMTIYSRTDVYCYFFLRLSSYCIRRCRWRFHDACFILFTNPFTMRTRWTLLPHLPKSPPSPSPHFFFCIHPSCCACNPFLALLVSPSVCSRSELVIPLLITNITRR